MIYYGVVGSQSKLKKKKKIVLNIILNNLTILFDQRFDCGEEGGVGAWRNGAPVVFGNSRPEPHGGAHQFLQDAARKIF